MATGPVLGVLSENDDGQDGGQTAEPTPVRSKMDEELRAIGAMLRILEDLGPSGAKRTLVYLADRYYGEHAF